MALRPIAVVVMLALAACGGDDGMTGPDAGVDASGEVTAAALLDALASCTVVGGQYATDDSLPATVDICHLPNAVFWKSDLDIDCDGKPSDVCNSLTDPSFQSQTAATDSQGMPLDAATLPYVVLPSPSTRWSYKTSGLAMGSVVAVIYGDHVEYGVAGDTGPTTIIGEASYRMAELLGIDPDPATGGADAGVAFIAFTGADAEVMVTEDHSEAVQIGLAHARALLGLP